MSKKHPDFGVSVPTRGGEASSGQPSIAGPATPGQSGEAPSTCPTCGGTKRLLYGHDKHGDGGETGYPCPDCAPPPSPGGPACPRPHHLLLTETCPTCGWKPPTPSQPWTSEHYNAIAVQRGDAYALSVAIDDIEKLRAELAARPAKGVSQWIEEAETYTPILSRVVLDTGLIATLEELFRAYRVTVEAHPAKGVVVAEGALNLGAESAYVLDGDSKYIKATIMHAASFLEAMRGHRVEVIVRRVTVEKIERGEL